MLAVRASRARVAQQLLTRNLSSSAAALQEARESVHPSRAPFSMAKVDHWSTRGAEQDAFMSHPVFDTRDIEEIKPKHRPPKDLIERLALRSVRTARGAYDLVTSYHPGMSEAKWIDRFIFLETVAGVPGMVGAMTRHLQSLRAMRRDKGWIGMLLAEAENERMHLMTFVGLRQSTGWLFRASVMGAQGAFWSAYFLAYLASPRFCHAFVGYLEEEAVTTYTKALAAMEDGGSLQHWRTLPAPHVARKYWHMPNEATMRDVILQVRADEAVHSDVNHGLAATPMDAPNPFLH